MLLKSIRVYDAERRQERRNKEILAYVNSLREQQPGFRITGWGLLKFFLYIAGVSAVLAFAAWLFVTLAFSFGG
jgi:hypothetical protein